MGAEMTREEFTRKYLQTIQWDIDHYIQHAADEMFDILVELSKQSQFCYEIFFPFSQSPDRFDELCQIYNFLNYCWKDDGDASLVHTTIRYHDFDGTASRFFVAKGFKNEIPLEETNELALRHGPSGSTLVEYYAINFYEDGLKFLHSLIPYVVELNKLCDQRDDEAYHDLSKDICAKVKEFIKSTNKCYHWQLIGEEDEISV